MLAKVQNYFLESLKEMKKVNWLNLNETAKMTTQVIIFSIVFALIYGIADFVFLKLIFIR